MLTIECDDEVLNSYCPERRLPAEVWPGFRATLGADLLHGPRSTFFGQFRDDDRVHVGVEASF